MSEKVSIVSVKHTGSPVYLGVRSGQHSWTQNPYEVLEWMGDSWRLRFNQHRSKRKKWEKVTRKSGKEQRILVPIGDSVTDVTDKQARTDFSSLAALPSMILQSAERIEDSAWWSAVKRRETSGGKMPRFRSKKSQDNIFACWFNKGSNATYQKTGKKTGIITIKGQNPSKHNKPGHKSRWTLKIRVKHSGREFSHYTSVQVNTTTMSAVFTSSPKGLTRSNNQHSIGIDRGGVVAVATSDGKSLTPDTKLTSQWDKKRTYHKKKMSKMRSRALNSAKKEFISKNPNTPKDELSHKAHQVGKEAMYQVMKGVQYQHHKERANHYSSKIAKYREAWQQEATTALVRSSDRIVLEDLKIKNMTRKGGKRKRGMNRSFLAFSPARFASMLEYKTLLSGGELIFVPPHYTSQRCNKCGYTAKENRESQAVFVCKNCEHKDNADNNAALNIRDYADYLYGLYQGTDLSASGEIQENGSGVIIRATPSKEDVEGFYTWKQPDHSDAINPSSVV